MALPPAHLLIGAAAAEGVRSGGIPPWRAWAFGGLVAVLPDVGSAALLWAGRPVAAHGLYTHTLLATLAVATLAGLLLGRRWGLVAGAAWASHLLVDLLREGATTSVYLAWPLSARPLAPLAPLFPGIPFEWTGAPGLFPQLAAPSPVQALAEQTLPGLALFVTAVAASPVVRRRLARRRSARAGHAG